AGQDGGALRDRLGADSGAGAAAGRRREVDDDDAAAAAGGEGGLHECWHAPPHVRNSHKISNSLLADPPPALPYFVRRSRMHNVPVYKDITHGCRKMTVIRKVEGDIWVGALESDVKDYLTQLAGKTPATQVNEVASSIRVKGYFDVELKNWLMDKGF
ncbi:hypothetical protein lerEdw1_007325, partial [Lerista edwardsae]